MAEKNQDLGITQKQDGDYTDIVIPDLDLLTTYGLQVAWVYADKQKGTSDFSDVFEFTTPGPTRPEVTNVVWVWEGTTLKGTWDNASNNAKTYQIYLTPVGGTSDLERSWTRSADQTQTKQMFTLTKDSNIGNFGKIFRTQFTGKIKTTYLDGTTSGVSFTTPAYADPVCTATISDSSWSVLSVPNGISVSWQDDITKAETYKYTNVYVSTSQSGPWVQYSGTSPVQIPLYNFNTHYVKINHFSSSECESTTSSIKEGKAYDPIAFDDIPPDPVQPPVTAAWNTDKALVVSYKMPAQNLPTYVKIFLTYNGTTKWFEKTVTTSTANASTSSIINRQEFIDAFGESPNSFTAGYITDMDVYRNENTTQVPISNITTAVKPNPLLGKTTTISVTGAANAYVVSSNLDSKATGIKVYQSSTENGTYTLVASSNSSPVIVYDESSAGSTVWVKAQWTSEDGNAEMSAATSVLILDVGALSIIENPIKIKTDGSIFAGTLDSNDEPVLTGARAVFNKRGFFLYDDNDANGLNPTTQIIGEDNGITATFITKKARIANWTISDNKIENTLNATAGSYAGLSPNGTYAFWAGGGVAGGYSVDSSQDAKFSVTPSGNVIARNIKVLGGEITVGSKFNVDTQGIITATDANLTGTIKAQSGILGSVDIGGSMIIGGVATNVDGQLRVTVSGATGGKVEIGKFTSPATGTGIVTVGAGIQVTNTSGGWYAQLDPTNGIVAKKGSIGGWKIDEFTLSAYANKVGMHAPAIPNDNSVAFWAGGLIDNPKFKVTYGGLLEAINAKIYGEVRSNTAKFGTFNDSNFTTLEKGWEVDGAQIKSTKLTASGAPVFLDGEWGAISGANVIASVLWLNPISAQVAAAETPEASADYGYDYISSAGHFRLGSGKIRYSSSAGLTINANLTASNLYLGDTAGSADYIIGKAGDGRSAGDFRLGAGAITNTNGVFKIATNQIYMPSSASIDDNDGTFGDSTIVVADVGYESRLVRGRALWYGGNNAPTNITSRYGFNVAFGANQGNGRFTSSNPGNFTKGDLWLQRV
jgi:hypothetical protein